MAANIETQTANQAVINTGRLCDDFAGGEPLDDDSLLFEMAGVATVAKLSWFELVLTESRFATGRFDRDMQNPLCCYYRQPCMYKQ